MLAEELGVLRVIDEGEVVPDREVDLALVALPEGVEDRALGRRLVELGVVDGGRKRAREHDSLDRAEQGHEDGHVRRVEDRVVERPVCVECGEPVLL